ncbi:signal peptidase II [Candidatus Woesebacteria bacterium]|nr:signal peptidase II [Candidatus Woesebacteria bacterium]
MPTTTKTTSRTRRQVQYVTFFVGVLAVDQLTKFFSPTFVLNTGISFALLSEIVVGPVLFVFLALGAWVSWRWLRVPAWSHAVFWAAAFSNVLDRFVFGGVRDIWKLPFVPLRNNFADWVIALVALYWMWYLYRQENVEEIDVTKDA